MSRRSVRLLDDMSIKKFRISSKHYVDCTKFNGWPNAEAKVDHGTTEPVRFKRSPTRKDRYAQSKESQKEHLSIVPENVR